MARTHGAQRGLDRFEGFTDGVFGIALTLLITEIKPPGAPQGPQVGASLVQAVAGQWREHLALLLGFAAIGTYWLQHHFTGRLYVRSDHWFSALNLLFLLAVIVVPYPLRLWCFHVGTPHEAAASVALAAGLAVLALTWMAKWFYARPRPLLDDRLAPDFVAQMTRRYGLATAVQFIAVAVALAAPRIGVALALATVLSFVLPPPRPSYRPNQEPSEDEIDA